MLPPPVEITASLKGNVLNWMVPDDSGSPLTNYRIYRGVGDGEPVLIGEVEATQTTFIDRRGSKGRQQVYYQVTAVNAFGESPRTMKFFVGQSMWSRPEPE
jgi:hypothetical protein